MFKTIPFVNFIISVFLLLCFFTTEKLFAQEAQGMVLKESLSLVGVKKVFLHASHSKLKLSAFSAEAKKIKILSNSNSLLNKVIVKQLKKGKNLHLWIFKKTFLGEAKSVNKKPFIGEFLIQMPSLPVVLVQDLGSVFVEFWKSSLVIKKWNGPIEIKNTEADISIFSQKGIINIEGHKGKLKIEAYDNKVSVNNSKGAFQLNVFSGSISINKVDAKINLSTYNASVLAEDVKGRLTVQAQNSSINLKKIYSTTRVKTLKGKVKVSDIGAISLNIFSTGKASIAVGLKARSAKIFILSHRFKAKVPAGLVHKSLGKGEQVKGILKGINPKAFVVLKSKKGRISLQL
ncbi:MAG: hypothetical protein HAW63_03815 [Bdellovibrionaceae bacterium]|nr:hypothetical protein [Pseudobdellovibrionaceae bacterium]